MKTFKDFVGDKYYKIINTQLVQPKLTANNILQNGFLVTNYYDAFYPSTGRIVAYWNEHVGWITVTMYFQNTILPTKFTFDCQWSPWGAASSGAYYPQLWASHAGSIWVQLGQGPNYTAEGHSCTIPVTQNSDYYNYFQFKVRQGGYGGEDEITVANLRLWGTYRTLQESTAQDYDVRGGEYKTQAFNLDNKFYMVKGD